MTLVGELQARVGYRFINGEPPQACRGCNLYQVCVGRLEPGVVYEVVAVREKKHPCKIHEGGVRVVEVVEAPIELALPPKLALEDLVVWFRPQKCSEVTCRFHRLCSPPMISKGEKFRVIKGDLGKLPCPRGLGLVKVLVKREPRSS